ncbi:hypothetical protein [Microbaculum marinum]|uniref:DsrE/DsrF-like family protein n=1 Tax=Microbaculum marinum TaxID=1764581 RepID=A0AAW9RVW9_9HYPH
MTRPVAANLVALVAFALLAFPVTAFAADGQHKLALQISDEDPQKMTAVLNVAANVSRYYSEIGEEVQIKIVAFNAGLTMLREDISPVRDRLTSFEQSMPNVEFLACDNTIQAIARKDGKAPPIVEMAEIVTAGVVTLIELDEAGWTIVRP